MEPIREHRDPLVDAGWLQAHLDHAQLRILDATVFLEPPTEPGRAYHARSGRAEWELAHIPGAGFADLVDELSEPHERLNFKFPSVERFERGLSRLGVADEIGVVVYDANGSMWATRLWWLLRAYGFDDARVLDGGWQAWVADGGPVTDAQPRIEPADFTPRPRPQCIATRDDVVQRLGSGETCLLNTLSPELFRGEGPPPYRRPGRLPGSTNVPWGSLLDPQTGCMLPPAVLRDRFESSAALSGQRVVAYCESGISATLDAFALIRLGVEDVAVYDGSLNEWAADPELPMETDDKARR